LRPRSPKTAHAHGSDKRHAKRRFRTRDEAERTALAAADTRPVDLDAIDLADIGLSSHARRRYDERIHQGVETSTRRGAQRDDADAYDPERPARDAALRAAVRSRGILQLHPPAHWRLRPSHNGEGRRSVAYLLLDDAVFPLQWDSLRPGYLTASTCLWAEP
jgi:hypothetical protein